MSGLDNLETAEMIGYCKSIDGENRWKGWSGLAVSTSSSSDEAVTLRARVCR